MKVFFAVLLVCSGFIGNAQKQPVQKLTAIAFKNVYDSFSFKQLIDVRTPEEFAGGHIKNAVNMNIYDIEFLEQLNTLDKNKPVFVYCKGGGRSADAVEQMQKMGFTKLFDLQGGIMGWEKEQLPMEASIPVADKNNLFTLKDFDQLLAQHPNILVDFYAHWCGPCKLMEPSLHRLTKQYKNQLTVYRINVDEAKDLAKALGIEGLPFITSYKNGRLFSSETGYLSYQQMRGLAKKLLKAK